MAKDIRQHFLEAVEKLEHDAGELGLPLKTVASQAGVSRSTPHRWRHETPATIDKLAKMQKVIARHQDRRR